MSGLQGLSANGGGVGLGAPTLRGRPAGPSRPQGPRAHPRANMTTNIEKVQYCCIGVWILKNVPSLCSLFADEQSVWMLNHDENKKIKNNVRFERRKND